MSGIDALGTFTKPASAAKSKRPKKRPTLKSIGNTEQSASTELEETGLSIDDSKLNPSILLQAMSLSAGDKAQLNLSLNKAVIHDLEALCKGLKVNKTFLVTLAILMLKEEITI